ncbi:MAG: hypothetical protein AB3N23_15155 [Paracoccaceae bacterium]
MSDAFLSPDWHRVSELAPRLRQGVRVDRHLYLGTPWHVISNTTGIKAIRLTPAAYAAVGRFDGAVTLQTLWDDLRAELGEEAPTQQDMVSLLTQLHQSDMLDSEDMPLLDEMLERQDKHRAQVWKKLFMNPLSVTVPLVNPDRFLAGLVAITGLLPRWMWWGAVLALSIAALVVLPVHWAALTARGLSGFLDLENLLLVALIYPVMKLLHEIAHGVAIKSRGGTVSEMGLMFIAFYPIPYVEASASLVFPSKWDRAAVAAAGVAVEIAVAALALFLWIGLEDGTARTLAFNTMIISGLSTLVVNGNPLLKFDGYHVLCDLIEIPNMSQRGNQWWGEMVRLYVFATREHRRTPTVAWERLWFLLYPPAAFVYRVVISMTIALFVAQTYRAVGVALALWSLALTLIWPTLKTAYKGLTDGRIKRAGARAWRGAGVVLVGLGVLLFVVKLPHRPVVQGVVWLPQDAFLRAGTLGHVETQLLTSGADVAQGDPLFRLSDPDLAAEIDVLQAEIQRLTVSLASVRFTDRSEAERLSLRLDSVEVEHARMVERQAALDIVAPAQGRLDIPDGQDHTGGFARQGELLAYVLPPGTPLIRLAVPQHLAADIRAHGQTAELRFATNTTASLPTELVREIPEGASRLPSAVLSLDGGGPFATVGDPDEPLRTVQPLFQFEMRLSDGGADPPPFGTRSYVRFSLPPKTPADRAGRWLRRSFLSWFDV